MSKQKANSTKRKRDKRYSGEGAAMSGKSVKRVSVQPKSRRKEWWEDNKMRILMRVVPLAIGLIFIWLVSLILRWIF